MPQKEAVSTDKAPPPLPFFSQAIKCQGMVYCSGSIGGMSFHYLLIKEVHRSDGKGRNWLLFGIWNDVDAENGVVDPKTGKLVEGGVGDRTVSFARGERDEDLEGH